MTRRQAYINARKYNFSHLILSGVDRRKAYAVAATRAAHYAFAVSTHSLHFVSVPVWAVYRPETDRVKTF